MSINIPQNLLLLSIKYYPGFKMTLTAENVLKIAHLARLGIESQEIPKYSRELSNIFELVAQMNAIDTSAILPMAHPLAEPQRLRLDELSEVNQRELFQAIAPLVKMGLYLVPKVIE